MPILRENAPKRDKLYLGSYRKYSCDCQALSKTAGSGVPSPTVLWNQFQGLPSVLVAAMPFRGGPGVQYHRTMQRFVATKNKVATYAVGVSLYSISSVRRQLNLPADDN